MAHSAKKKHTSTSKKGYAYIKASFNNIIISITNENKEVKAWSSAGKMRFKGSKKSTPYAAHIVATDCAKQALSLGISDILIVYAKHPGRKEAAIRSLGAAGLTIKAIKDTTPVPHNGCRPIKRRKG